MTRSRRRLLRTGALAGVLALAGCTGQSDGTDEADAGGDDSTSTETAEPTSTADSTPEPTGTATDEPASDDGTATSTPTATGDDALDLREANVVGVSLSNDGGDVRFDVTLYHDDEGEDGYADWWQVESLDGERLGRRELLHAHGTQEFTRSATVTVPGGASCVVVRGHDQTHGYGGRAALVNPDSGAVRFVEQGSEPRSFSEADCP